MASVPRRTEAYNHSLASVSLHPRPIPPLWHRLLPTEAYSSTFWLRVFPTEAYKMHLAPVSNEPRPKDAFGTGF